MNAFRTLVSASLIVLSAGAGRAAINPATGLPVESKQQIADRCGIELTNPNAIVEAAGAACGTVGVLATLQPMEPNAKD